MDLDHPSAQAPSECASEHCAQEASSSHCGPSDSVLPLISETGSHIVNEKPVADLEVQPTKHGGGPLDQMRDDGHPMDRASSSSQRRSDEHSPPSSSRGRADAPKAGFSQEQTDDPAVDCAMNSANVEAERGSFYRNRHQWSYGPQDAYGTQSSFLMFDRAAELPQPSMSQSERHGPPRRADPRGLAELIFLAPESVVNVQFQIRMPSRRISYHGRVPLTNSMQQWVGPNGKFRIGSLKLEKASSPRDQTLIEYEIDSKPQDSSLFARLQNWSPMAGMAGDSELVQRLSKAHILHHPFHIDVCDVEGALIQRGGYNLAEWLAVLTTLILHIAPSNMQENLVQYIFYRPKQPVKMLLFQVHLPPESLKHVVEWASYVQKELTNLGTSLQEPPNEVLYAKQGVLSLALLDFLEAFRNLPMSDAVKERKLFESFSETFVPLESFFKGLKAANQVPGETPGAILQRGMGHLVNCLSPFGFEWAKHLHILAFFDPTMEFLTGWSSFKFKDMGRELDIVKDNYLGALRQLLESDLFKTPREKLAASGSALKAAPTIREFFQAVRFFRGTAWLYMEGSEEIAGDYAPVMDEALHECFTKISERRRDQGSGRATLRQQWELALEVEQKSVGLLLAPTFRNHLVEIFQEILYLESDSSTDLISKSLFFLPKSRDAITHGLVNLITSPHAFINPLLSHEVHLISTVATTSNPRVYASGRAAMANLASQEVSNSDLDGPRLAYEEVLKVWIQGAARRKRTEGEGDPIYLSPISFLLALEELLNTGVKPQIAYSLSQIAMSMALEHCPNLSTFLQDSKKIGPSKYKALQDHYLKAAKCLMESEFNGIDTRQLDEVCGASLLAICQKTSQGTLQIQQPIGEHLCVMLLVTLMEVNDYLQKRLQEHPIETITGSKLATLLMQIEKCPPSIQSRQIYSKVREACLVLGDLLKSGNVSLRLINTSLDTGDWEKIFRTLGQASFVTAVTKAHKDLEVYKKRLEGFKVLVLNIIPFLQEKGIITDDFKKWKEWLKIRCSEWESFTITEIDTQPHHWPMEAHKSLYEYLDPIVNLHQSRIFLNLLLEVAQRQIVDDCAPSKEGEPLNRTDMCPGVSFAIIASDLMPQVVELYLGELELYVGNDIDFGRIMMERMCALLDGVHPSAVETELEHARIQLGLNDTRLSKRVIDNMMDSLSSWKGINAMREMLTVLPMVASVFDLNEDCGGVVLQIWNVVTECTPFCSLRHFEEVLLENGQNVLTLFSAPEASTLKVLATTGPLIAFLKESVHEDLRHLLDAVEDPNSSQSWEGLINDLIDLQRIFRPVLSAESPSFEDLRTTISGELSSSSSSSYHLSQKLEACNERAHALRQHFLGVANRTYKDNDQICRILKNATYFFSLDKGSCSLELICWDEKPFISGESLSEAKARVGSLGFKSYNLAQSQELRSRARWTISSNTFVKKSKTAQALGADWAGTDATNLETTEENAKEFIRHINIAEQLVALLTQLYKCGHFQYATYGREVSGFSSLQILTDYLGSELRMWNSALKRAREDCPCLNYFRAVELRMILQTLIGESPAESGPRLQHCLDLIEWTGIARYESSHFEAAMDRARRVGIPELITEIANSRPDEKEELLYRCLLRLGEVGELSFINHKERPNFELTSEGRRREQGLILMLVEDPQHELDVVATLFHERCLSLHGNASNVILCDPLTVWEDLYLLILRCFNNHQRREDYFYCIAYVERLSFDCQGQLLTFLQDAASEHQIDGVGAGREEKNELAIVSCSQSQSLHTLSQQLQVRVCHMAAGRDDAIQEQMADKCREMWVVTSDLPGMGKTTFVREISESASTDICIQTLCISGEVSRDLLIIRLKELNLEPKMDYLSTVLHLDISIIQNPETLNVLLFELLILGCLKSNQAGVFHLNTKKVAIEVANTYQNQLAVKLPVCNRFRKKHLVWDMAAFRASKSANGDDQVVCNYLIQMERGNLATWNPDSTAMVLDVACLSSKQCQELLQRYFVEPLKDSRSMSFTLLQTFIKFFARQLRELSKSMFFTPENLSFMHAMASTRDSLVTSMLEVSRNLAMRSVKPWLDEQQDPSMGTSTEVSMAARMDQMVRWSDCKNAMIFFQKGGPITVLYRDPSHVPRSLADLFQRQKTKLLNYEALTSTELFAKLWPILHTAEPSFRATYVLTADNLLKMALIYLKVKASVPVVLMGETGCGKTSLLRELAKYCGVTFSSITLHAGTTEDTIRGFLSKAEDEAKEKADKEPNIEARGQVWAFLDEINACDHLGLLVGVVCHHFFDGKPLHSNLKILAACNPYRKHDSKKQRAGLSALGKSGDAKHLNMAYTVHVLPEAIVDHLYDFGILNPKDERSYIHAMVLSGTKGKVISFPFIELLVESQAFVREKHGEASVSLRDVSRCIALYKWFCHDLDNRPRLKENTSRATSANSKERRAALLSFAHCYYYRLATDEERTQYRAKYEATMNGRKVNLWSKLKSKEKFTGATFEEGLRMEQMDLLDRMEIPPGIAKNQALRENIFVTLVCILNKIPLFVVGKPGSGKTLSLQLIFSNMRGTGMKDLYFNKLPTMFMFSYQGSESSTSEGILKVFEKAYRCVEDNRKKNVQTVVVVVLDEVGLAEISSHNPLKVLHALLEPDGKQQVAVVGISNWSLDAAKMNRAIHISQPDPKEVDLVTTGAAILDSYGMRRIYDSKMTELGRLAKAYHDYHVRQSKPDFHGLRDFYSLIKSLRGDHNHLKVWSDGDLERAVWRNFGGSPEDVVLLTSILRAHFNTLQFRAPHVLDLVRTNLHDKDARHLMLITTGDSAIGILEHMLPPEEKLMVIHGSKYAEDVSDDYAYLMLSNIILHMEDGRHILLSGAERVWSSLYDMLNQHFTVVGGRRNCRIAIGAFSNPMCYVHDNFRCIVVVDQNQVARLDPPFLNRFEKQVLTYDILLTPAQREVVKNLNTWVKAMACVFEDESSSEELLFCENDLFAGYGADTLASIVLAYCKDTQSDSLALESMCKKTLIETAYADGMVRAHYSETCQREVPDAKLWTANYLQKDRQALKDVICGSIGDEAAWQDEMGFKLVITTRSNVHTDIRSLLKDLHDMTIQIIKLGEFTAERQLQANIQHWSKSDANLLIIQADAVTDKDHIPLAKVHVERDRTDFVAQAPTRTKPKHVVFIVHSHRGDHETQSAFSFLSGWKQLTLDQLQHEDMNFREYLDKSIWELVQSERFLEHQNLMVKVLTWSFLCIKYPRRRNSARYCQDMVQKICGDKDLYNCFVQRAIVWLKKHTEEVWQTDVVCNRGRLALASNLHYAFFQYVEEKLREPIARLIYVLERASALGSYFNMLPEWKKLWRKVFMDGSIIGIDNVPQPMHPEGYTVKGPLDLHLPFSHLFAQHLDRNFRELYLTRFSGLQQDEAGPRSLSTEIAQDINVSLQTNECMRLVGACVDANPEEYCQDFAKMYAPYQSDERTALEALVFEWLLREKVPGLTASRLHALVWATLEQLVAQAHLARSCFTAGEIATEIGNLARMGPTQDFDKSFASRCVVKLLPSQEVISKFGGVQNWLQWCDILIKLVSCVEGPRHGYIMLMLHVLRDFGRLIVCPLGIATESLSSMSKWFEQKHLKVETDLLIEKVMILLPDINMLKGRDREVYFRFVASFFNRLLASKMLTKDGISTMTTLLFSFTAPTCLMKSIMVQLLDVKIQSLELDPALKCPLYLRLLFVKDRNFIKEQAWASKSYEPFVLLGDVIHESLRGSVTPELMSGADIDGCTYESFDRCLRVAMQELTKHSGTLNFRAACSVALLRAVADVLAQDLLTVHKQEPSIFRPCLAPKVILAEFFAWNHYNVLASKQYLMKVLRNHCGLSIQLVSHLSHECNKNQVFELYASILDWEMLKGIDNPLGFNPFSSLTPGYEEAEKLLWDITYSEGEKLEELKRSMVHSRPTQYGAFASAVASKFFLVQALNEKEEAVVEWLRDKDSIYHWPLKWQQAIQCLAGTGPLQLSNDLTSPEVLWFKVLAAHVLVVVLLLPSDSPLQGYLMQDKAHLVDGYVLSIPDSLLASLRGALLNKENLAEYKHSCGYIYTIGNCTKPFQTAKCPNCGGTIGGENHILTSGNTALAKDRIEKGYIVDSVARTHMYYTVRGLGLKVYRALRIVVHYCILLSLYLGERAENFAKVLGVPEQAVIEEVETMIKEDLTKLGELLNCNREVTCQYMHCIISAMARTPPGRRLSSPGERASWEQAFGLSVTLLSLKSVHEATADYLEKHRGQHELTELLEERRVQPFPGVTAAFMRITAPPSLKNFKAAFMQDQGRQRVSPLIELFFRHEKRLGEMKYLMGLLRFSRAIHENLHSKIKRPEAVSITMNNFHTDKSLEDSFEDFANSWNKMRLKVTAFECTEFKKPIPEMTGDCPVGMCLVESRDLGIYLAAFLEHLRNIQNAFLDDVAAIGGFPPAYLDGESGGPPSVRVHMCKGGEVIDFEEDWAEVMVCDVGMADLQYSQGLNPLYDDYTIEQHLRGRLLDGKARLDEWEEFMYEHEAFHKHMTILSDVGDLISQSPMRPEVMLGIQSEINLGVVGAGRYLATLDLCLGFLRRTGGDPTEPLGSYCERWLGDEARLVARSPAFDAVQLQHVVSLYEGLEDCASVGIRGLVNSRYRTPLTRELVEELKTSVATKRSPRTGEPKISAELFHENLRRFMFRYLIADNLNADNPLSSYITNPTLMRWPEDVVDEVDDLFPPSLLLKHSHAAYLYLSEMLKAGGTAKP